VSDDDLGKYSDAPQGAARFVAQHLIMKPYIWSALRVHTHGDRYLEDLQPPFIVIANHSSHLDATLIFGALPRRLSQNLAAGAAADYFFQSKLKALSTRLFFNTYPVDRGGMRAHRGMSGRLLNDGVPILLFPEGTRSRTGAMASFKTGVAQLSISHNVPVLPIALVGAYAAMPYGAKVPVSGRPHVHVVFGHPQYPTPGESAGPFTERLHRAVLEQHDSTARAYGMPTQADFARAVALRAASAEQRRLRAQESAEAKKDQEKSQEEPPADEEHPPEDPS
jgi:1-acyl-sn-glycerol-3-phosphate acyltransferase